MESLDVLNLGDALALPEVMAPSLENLSVTLPAPAGFTAEQVQERFLKLARPHATERYRSLTEQIAWRDEVLLSIACYSQGKLIPFGIRNDVWLPMEPEPLLPGLYEAIVGRCPSEDLVVELTLPREYPVPALRGSTVCLVVHLQAAREVTYPNLESPEFLRAFGRGNTLEEATLSVVKQLEREHAQVLAAQARQRVLSEVASRAQVRISPELIDEELRRRWSASEGGSVSELNFTPPERQEALRTWLQDEELRSEAEQRLRIALVLGAICKRDRLTLTPEWVEKLLQEEAAASGLTLAQVLESLRAEPQHQARIDQVAWHLMAVEHVMSRARIHFEGA